MSAYGFEIVQMLLVETKLDEHVKKVMTEINAGKCSFWIEHYFSSPSLWVSFASFSLTIYMWWTAESKYLAGLGSPFLLNQYLSNSTYETERFIKQPLVKRCISSIFENQR